jgi:nucleoid DNA-binding protein
MTKSELIEAVMKSVKDDDLSKRLTTDIIGSAFDAISKSIKNVSRQPNVYQLS